MAMLNNQRVKSIELTIGDYQWFTRSCFRTMVVFLDLLAFVWFQFLSVSTTQKDAANLRHADLNQPYSIHTPSV